MDDVSKLTLLGSQQTEYKLSGPSAEMLESFPNPRIGRDYIIEHKTDEFTSLCPKTGQPDYAKITVRYTPDKTCVETKSLKLYWFAYRNEGSFMETIVNRMLDDLILAIQPEWMRIVGKFKSRGGIHTTVEVEHQK